MAGVADRIAAARLWLISEGAAELTYLSQGVYALRIVETTDVPRVAADEHWRLYVNPEWALEVEVPELGRQMAHHLWHLLLEHADRARALNVDRSTAKAWRNATDLAVRDVLSADAVCPDDLATDAEALRLLTPGLPAGRPAEEYWATLTRLPAEGAGGSASDQPAEGREEPDDRDEGSASDGIPRPWELPADADLGALSEGEAGLVRTAVAIAYTGRRGGRGDEAGEAARWVRRMTEPELPWPLLLAQATRRGVGWTSGRTHTTYSRPNRRAASVPGVLLPGWRRLNPRVACIVDTSGSVDDALLGKAMAEVDGALTALGVAGTDVTVLACDAAVHTVQRLRSAASAQLVGGGGTDLRVALAAVDELRPRPSLVVVFTDGYTPWPTDPPPGCAVVIALLLRRGEEAPPVPEWATGIRCQLD